jgi:vacuolar protein sorting-associated protein 1
VDNPIKLEIHATNAPDLTLIDLPGITRIPLAGSDQPQDIERITTHMTKK